MREKETAVDYPDLIILIMITLITLIIKVIRAPVVAMDSLTCISPRIVESEMREELHDARRPEERQCENIASHVAEDIRKCTRFNEE